VVEIDEGNNDENCVKKEKHQKIKAEIKFGKQQQGDYCGNKFRQWISPGYFFTASRHLPFKNK
jgi:hypothetical protein